MQQQSARQTRAVFQRTQFAWVLRHQHGCVRPDWLRAPQRHQQPVCGLRRQHAPGASALGSAASHQHSGLRETTGSSIRQGQQHSQHPQHQLGLDDAGADSPAAAMRAFLAAYGVPEPDIRRLAAECPELFGLRSSSSSSSCGCSPYETGRVLLLLHAMGWTHAQVLQRIMRIYPQLLRKHVDHDMLPVLAHLRSLGCSDADVQLLVWEYPRIFCCGSSTELQRRIRRFQVLGLYGLPPPGSASTDTACVAGVAVGAGDGGSTSSASSSCTSSMDGPWMGCSA